MARVLVIINREATEFDEIADLVVREDIGTVLAPLDRPLIRFEILLGALFAGNYRKKMCTGCGLSVRSILA